jgi:hypothetical protein
MRRVSALAALALPALVGASPRIVPQLAHEPLGALVRDSTTIHALRVESVGKDGAKFKTEAALAPLMGMPLTALLCAGTRVRGLSPLRGLPLESIWCDFRLTDVRGRVVREALA